MLEQLNERVIKNNMRKTWITLRNSLVPLNNLDLVIALYNLKMQVEEMRYFVKHNKPMTLEDIIPVNDLIMDIKDKSIDLVIATIPPKTYKDVIKLTVFINETNELLDKNLISLMGEAKYTIFKEISDKINYLNIECNALKIATNTTYGIPSGK